MQTGSSGKAAWRRREQESWSASNRQNGKLGSQETTAQSCSPNLDFMGALPGCHTAAEWLERGTPHPEKWKIELSQGSNWGVIGAERRQGGEAESPGTEAAELWMGLGCLGC